jgi:hypothetical protein
MEAARSRDEAENLRAGFDATPDRVFHLLVENLIWEDEATRSVADTIWRCVGQGHTQQAILNAIARCDRIRYGVLRRMIDAGLIC